MASQRFPDTNPPQSTRAPATELIADQGHHRVPVLVDRREEHADDSAVRLGRRGPRLEHLRHHVQRVSWADRSLPANFVQARRAEAARRDRTCLEEQLEGDRDRLKSARDEAAVHRRLRRLGVGLEYLRVVEPSDLGDERTGNRQPPRPNAATRLPPLQPSPPPPAPPPP